MTRRTHTGDVDDGVDALDGLGKVSSVAEVVHLDKVELVVVLWPRFLHRLAFGQGPGRPPDLEAFREEDIDDVGADEARRPGDEDMLSTIMKRQRVCWVRSSVCLSACEEDLRR